MLNSIEHEIKTAYKYQICKNQRKFMPKADEHEIYSAHKMLKCQQLFQSLTMMSRISKFILLINVKMSTIVGILTLMNRIRIVGILTFMNRI